MSGREWQFGDVAMIEVHDNRHVGIFVGGGWRYADDMRVSDDSAIATVRPLVVIDPEDRQQLERLADAFTEAEDSRTITASQHRVDAMRDALCSLINPPKPPEPTGLGAVVEDADGVLWVRVSSGWFRACTGGNSRGRYRRYTGVDSDDPIAAVRVLSEGVTP